MEPWNRHDAPKDERVRSVEIMNGVLLPEIVAVGLRWLLLGTGILLKVIHGVDISTPTSLTLLD